QFIEYFSVSNVAAGTPKAVDMSFEWLDADGAIIASTDSITIHVVKEEKLVIDESMTGVVIADADLILKAAPGKAEDAQTVADIKGLFKNPANQIVIEKNGQELTDADVVGTGCVIKLLSADGTIADSLTVVLKGDVKGIGYTSIGSLVKMSGHITGGARLDGAYLKAADMNGNGNVSIGDIVLASNLIVA
ncbi:MAG: hypothetical protein VB082_08925, partial [Christensenella sp.]|nr:hypothetical protein [Christensenella sp.]